MIQVVERRDRVRKTKNRFWKVQTVEGREGKVARLLVDRGLHGTVVRRIRKRVHWPLNDVRASTEGALDGRLCRCGSSTGLVLVLAVF